MLAAMVLWESLLLPILRGFVRMGSKVLYSANQSLEGHISFVQFSLARVHAILEEIVKQITYRALGLLVGGRS
ncbi:unnamed protein product [Cuscuta campestris]|uniref:ABC transmembrane type-1 domain-containing protein n=1 Tax=Cuscuta campestris TaxID=132261 RepID=A0A484M4Q8_9ASTE|nr:unnamed protein product [Cuscuta campestris]